MELFCNYDATVIAAIASAFATIVLVGVNIKLLTKYDYQRKIDIFYHSFQYRKDLLDELMDFSEKHFSKRPLPNTQPALPWQYTKCNETIDQLMERPYAKEARNILKKLNDARLAFPKHKNKLDESIEKIKAFDEALRRYCRDNNKQENKMNYVEAYSAIHNDRFSVDVLQQELEFPN